MRKRSLLAFGILAAWALGLGAQEPSPQTSFGESIDVRVVNVEAVVTDAKGKRVRGLTARDFQLEVDGREVPIEFFAEVSEGEVARPAGESAAAAPAAPAESAARNILVFIDDLFAVGRQRDTVLDGLERDLKLLGPQDRMAIVALGRDGRPEVLSRWTGDRAALAAALQIARKRRAWGNDVVASRRSIQNDQELIQMAKEDGSLSVYENGDGGGLSGARGVNSYLGGMSGVDSRLYSRLLKIPVAVVATMQSLTPPPGRKVLLLVSGGWPIARLMIPIFVEANRLGYTAYPVDAQGIEAVTTGADATMQTPGGGAADSSLAWERGAHDGLELLARATGGKAILNSARVNALERTVEDTGSFYWLGFTPEWKGDDRHHRIQVKPRSKNLVVRSRRGYSDVSRATQASLTGYGALLLGGDPKDKRLGVQIGRPEIYKDSILKVPVTVMVPIADLTSVEQDGGRRLIEAVLAFGVVDKHGGFSDYIEVPLRLTLPHTPRPGDLSRYNTSLKLRRIEQRLVFTVRDPLTGTVLWGEAEVKP